jgi:hypothetical protein
MSETKNGWRALLLHPFFGHYGHLEEISLEDVSASIYNDCLIFTKNQGCSAWYWHSIPVKASLIPIPVP